VQSVWIIAGFERCASAERQLFTGLRRVRPFPDTITGNRWEQELCDFGGYGLNDDEPSGRAGPSGLAAGLRIRCYTLRRGRPKLVVSVAIPAPSPDFSQGFEPRSRGPADETAAVRIWTSILSSFPTKRADSRSLARFIVLALLLAAGCASVAPEAQGDGSVAAQGDAVFTDEARASGLDFVHFNGLSGEYYLFEIMAGGTGLLDYDNDGDLDVYLVQGAVLGPPAKDARRGTPSGVPAPLTDRLFRNDLSVDSHGRPVLRFTDVTADSGLDARGFGMGLATGDYDNDGWVDVYVTNFGPNQLFHNNGDGTFTDVTETSGTAEPRWSVSATFVDVDGDRLLDLYVGNYVDMTVATNVACFNKVRDYCSPLSYRPVPDRLFRNRGDGTFEDVTASSQLAQAYGNGLGVATADFDGDGRIDIYVANDGVPNQAWINRGQGRFEDTALLAGCALNEQGEAEAGMGIAVADFDDDGDEDLFVTHLRNETSTLYVNDGRGSFSDETILTGLGQASRAHTGFGTSFFDFDNDGRLDLISFNGAVTAIEALVEAGDPYPYHEQNQLFRNEGGGRFTDVSHRAGETFASSEISRGAAFGDVDNDGDTDVLVMQVNGPARLLINKVGNQRHWIGLSLLGDVPARPLHGTRVAVLREGQPPLWRRVHTDGSYASASDPRILVGLGDTVEPLEIYVQWPGGATEVWDAIESDRWITLEEGGGKPAAAELPATRLASVAATGRTAPGPPSAEATRDDVKPPPELELPPLDRFEIAVREQLGRSHAALRDLLATQDPDPTRLADAYGELGLQLQAYDLRQSAVNSYRHAERLAPEDYRWAHLLGSVLQSVGDADRARKRFRRVVTLEPRYAPAWVYLGQLELEQNRRAEARDAFNRALAIEPDCTPCRVGLGRVALLDADYERALELFRQALELSPASSNIHYHLAMSFRGLGQVDEAKRHLEQRGPVKAGIADPLLAEVPTRLRGSRALQDQGVALARSGHLEQAIERFREALKLDPEDSMTRFYVGLAQAKLGRLDAARDAFLEAIRLDPRSQRAHLFLGSVLALQGNDPGAAEAFAAALEIHPGLTAARNERAKALQRLGRYAAALEEFEEVLRGDPGNAEARLYRAFALIRLGRYAEAAGNAEKDREVLPEQPAFAHIQARLLAAAPAPGIRDGEQALRLTDDLWQAMRNVELAETMAMALAELGRFDEAVQWQSAAFERARELGAEDRTEWMSRNLARYRRREPCREPWRDDDPLFVPPRNVVQSTMPVRDSSL
jgi:tetratricopeptide (TPR) repeat protein